jgi:casein kinase II subunit alpha
MGFQGADIGIVLEYIENIDYRTLYPRFTHSDIRYYTKELLKALEFAHDLGVMHRDVRPLNVVIDHRRRKVILPFQKVHGTFLTRNHSFDS